MPDRSKFLVHARRLHNALRRAIEDGDAPPETWLSVERPLFEHFASGMYLAGVLAFLEGQYGKNPLRPRSPHGRTFDEFLLHMPERQARTFADAGISKIGIEALVCIRNALTHNDSDLGRNSDKSSLAKVVAACIPGVSVNGTLVTLSSTRTVDFMEYVRKSLVAIAMFHGDG